LCNADVFREDRQQGTVATDVPGKGGKQATSTGVVADGASDGKSASKPAWKVGLPKAAPIVTDAVPAGPALSREYCIKLQLR